MADQLVPTYEAPRAEEPRVVVEHLPYKQVYTYDEVAFLLSQRRRYVEELVASKQLLTVAPGRVSKRQLDDYVRAREEEAQVEKGRPKPPPTRPKRRSRTRDS